MPLASTPVFALLQTSGQQVVGSSNTDHLLGILQGLLRLTDQITNHDAAFPSRFEDLQVAYNGASHNRHQQLLHQDTDSGAVGQEGHQ